MVGQEPPPAGDAEGPRAVESRVEDRRDHERDPVGELGGGTAPHRGREEAEVQGGGEHSDAGEANELLREAGT